MVVTYGLVYDAAGYTDMLVEWGGDGPVKQPTTL